MLWGNFAKGKSKFIDTEKHFILEGGHPSPLSAKYWFGCGHFKEANRILDEELQMDEIDWQV
jgi:uracil-DNA glycosylase